MWRIAKLALWMETFPNFPAITKIRLHFCSVSICICQRFMSWKRSSICNLLWSSVANYLASKDNAKANGKLWYNYCHPIMQIIFPKRLAGLHRWLIDVAQQCNSDQSWELSVPEIQKGRSRDHHDHHRPCNRRIKPLSESPLSPSLSLRRIRDEQIKDKKLFSLSFYPFWKLVPICRIFGAASFRPMTSRPKAIGYCP